MIINQKYCVYSAGESLLVWFRMIEGFVVNIFAFVNNPKNFWVLKIVRAMSKDFVIYVLSLELRGM